MSRVIITTNDPVVYSLMDEKESGEMFGDDFIREYGVDIPEELLRNYQEAYKTFWQIQGQIRQYRT